MSKRMYKINKQYLGREVESLDDLNTEMEELDAFAVVRKIQMLSFDEDESEGLYVYRINGTKDAIVLRSNAKQIAPRVYQVPTYRSTWPF